MFDIRNLNEETHNISRNLGLPKCPFLTSFFLSSFLLHLTSEMCDFKRGRDRQGVSRSRRCPINAPSICQSAWPHQGLCHPLAIRHSSDDNPATVNAQCPYMYYPAHLNTDFSVQTAHLIQSNSEQGGKLLRPPYQTSVLLSSYSQEQ